MNCSPVADVAQEWLHIGPIPTTCPTPSESPSTLISASCPRTPPSVPTTSATSSAPRGGWSASVPLGATCPWISPIGGGQPVDPPVVHRRVLQCGYPPPPRHPGPIESSGPEPDRRHPPRPYDSVDPWADGSRRLRRAQVAQGVKGPRGLLHPRTTAGAVRHAGRRLGADGGRRAGQGGPASDRGFGRAGVHRSNLYRGGPVRLSDRPRDHPALREAAQGEARVRA